MHRTPTFAYILTTFALLAFARVGFSAPADDLNALNKQFHVARQKRDYATAEQIGKQIIALAERTMKDHPKNFAVALHNLAILYKELGRYEEGERLFSRSVAILENSVGPDALEVANGLDGLGSIYRAMGNYGEAEKASRRSLQIRQSKLGSNHADISLNDLATALSAIGKYDQAESLYRRSLAIREERLGRSHIETAKSLHNLAKLYLDTDRNAQAKPLLERSVSILEAKLGRDDPYVALAVYNLALASCRMGQYTEAEMLFERSLRAREAAFGPEHPDVAQSLASLGRLQELRGQYAKAEANYQRSLSIRERKLGADSESAAVSLNGLGLVYLAMHEYAKAQPLLQRSLATREGRLGPDHPAVAESLDNLAILYSDMGDYAKAEPLHRRALKINQGKFGTDSLSAAVSLNGLASLCFSRGQYVEAKSLFQRSWEIYHAKLGPDHPEVAARLWGLALVCERLNQHGEASKNLDLARRIVRKHVARVLPALDEQEQLAFVEHTDESKLHVALSYGLLYGNDPVIAETSAGWLFNGKEVIHESLAENALLARDSDDPQIAEQLDQLRSVRTQLADLSHTVPNEIHTADYRRQMLELSSRERELLQEINLAAGRPAREDPWIESAAVREALPRDAVLVDVACFRPHIFEAKHGGRCWQPERYVAWVVPPRGSGKVRVIDLGDAQNVDKAVAAARSAIDRSADQIQPPADEGQAEQAAIASLTALARLVLQPLLPAIAEARELILSPDSELWLVPWAALPVEEGKYAIERWRIRHVTSGRNLALEKMAEDAKLYHPTRARIFADPDYDLDEKSRELATRAVLRGREKELAARSAVVFAQNRLPRFDRLPLTAEEARLITPSLHTLTQEAPTLYSQQYALEGVFKIIQSPRILVLSTHGFYMPDQEVKNDDDDRMIRAGSDLLARRAAALGADGSVLENPLLRCGLLLAGCNQRRQDVDVDDGILTGMEIVGCDLRGTELAVLSACETGIGEVWDSEGVAGLRQAFQLAGAKAVLSTLWRIPDRETVALMNGLFNHLASGENKAEALRAAQIAKIKERRREFGAAHPYYWAAFTLTGN